MIDAISLITWVDLTDKHEYHTGDKFPHDGRNIDKKRINELLSEKNAIGYPVIAIKENETEVIEE